MTATRPAVVDDEVAGLEVAVDPHRVAVPVGRGDAQLPGALGRREVDAVVVGAQALEARSAGVVDVHERGAARARRLGGAARGVDRTQLQGEGREVRASRTSSTPRRGGVDPTTQGTTDHAHG